jgi:hypothetical protein
MGNAPQIGVHLATLNLFREADGAYITIAAGTGAIDEWREKPELAHANVRPVDYVEMLIIEAAERLRQRHELRGLIANPAIQIEAKPRG